MNTEQHPHEAQNSTTQSVPWRRVLRYGTGAVLAVVSLGGVLGWMWWFLSPVLRVRVEDGAAYSLDEHPEQYLSSGLVFAALACAASVGACVLVWRYLPRGVLTLLGGVVGVILACTVMRYTGEWIGEGEVQSMLQDTPSSDETDIRVTELRITAFLVLPAVLFAALYTVFVVASPASDLRNLRSSSRNDRSGENVSDGTELGSVTTRASNADEETPHSPHA